MIEMMVNANVQAMNAFAGCCGLTTSTDDCSSVDVRSGSCYSD